MKSFVKKIVAAVFGVLASAPFELSACPSCREAVSATQGGFSQGIGVAIFFLLAVIYGLAAVVIFLMIRAGTNVKGARN